MTPSENIEYKFFFGPQAESEIFHADEVSIIVWNSYKVYVSVRGIDSRIFILCYGHCERKLNKGINRFPSTSST